MEAKTLSPQTQAVQKRFFEAIEALKDKEMITGLQPFCEEHGLHKAKYSTLRSSLTKSDYQSRYKLIDFDALIILVKIYGVSGDWLLTGRGLMFKRNV